MKHGGKRPNSGRKRKENKRKYKQIQVSEEVFNLLFVEKGKMTWDEFLLEKKIKIVKL